MVVARLPLKLPLSERGLEIEFTIIQFPVEEGESVAATELRALLLRCVNSEWKSYVANLICCDKLATMIKYLYSVVHASTHMHNAILPPHELSIIHAVPECTCIYAVASRQHPRKSSIYSLYSVCYGRFANPLLC